MGSHARLLAAMMGRAACLRAAGRQVPSRRRRCSSSSAAAAATHSAHHRQEAALYVHWPFCLRRCSYCNFNKYVRRSSEDDVMIACLQREAETLLQLSQVTCVSSVFFGGGTPSLAPPSAVAAVLEAVSGKASLSAGAEVTLEVNPTPAGRSKLEEFRAAGVNRFSVGVQSLQDEQLRALGRDHDSRQALRTLEEARRLCPGRVSADLMFGRPGQTPGSWGAELRELLSVCDDHVSLYQLTVERGTPLFRQVRRGETSVASEDAAADMYRLARLALRERGFRQYEVSNFARNNAVGRHNVSCWSGSQYIGVGPGAHGRFVAAAEGGVLREARTQTLEPEVWVQEVRRRGHGTRRRSQLGPLQVLEELLATCLRMTEGISHQRWQVFSPQLSLHHVFGSASSEIQQLLLSGQLILDDRGLRCSWEGLAFLDSFLPPLLLQLQTCFPPNPRR